MAQKFNKDALFENYFRTADDAISQFERVFKINGVWNQFFGVEHDESHLFKSVADQLSAKHHVRSSDAWQTLSMLYDYAVDGVINDSDPTNIVIDGAEVLSFIKTENTHYAPEWEMIIALGDGRFALDDGENVLIEKLALLAGVDVRTVRNAISSGELIAYKSDFGPSVDNACARKWLNSRRGFKRTIIAGDTFHDLKDISTPAIFGAFLTEKRKKLGLCEDIKKLIIFHPSIDTNALSEIESGIFNLSLDTVFPLADFYQLDRKEFLSCVMRVFFCEELSTLRENNFD